MCYDCTVMINFRHLMFSVFIVLFINNIVFAEELYCFDTGYSGSFDINKKPNTHKCDNLKDYDLSYGSCMSSLQDELNWYNYGLESYKKGNCYQYKTATNKYGSATCSVQYVVNKYGYTMKEYNYNVKNADANNCIEQLQNSIKQKQIDLQKMQ